MTRWIQVRSATRFDLTKFLVPLPKREIFDNLSLKGGRAQK
jgi:hypothetical protein